MIQRGWNILAHALLILVSLLAVTSCGSGSVGAPPVNDPAKITILPDTAVLYSGLPTTFSITGGTGTYIVTSSNQAVIPNAGTLVNPNLTIVPNPVTTETLVTLTARDSGATAPVSATLTVRPGTVSNLITITPGSSLCSPAICAGGDAVVSVTISQGGIPFAARGVRFDVISGEFAFITSAVGAPETLAANVATVTDETGIARARLRAGTSAANQSGILQITDLASGAYQRATIFIARTSITQSNFFTVPSAITFTGPDNQTCASSSSVASEVFIFGGSPPYTIGNSAPNAFLINTNVVAASGGSVRVTPSPAAVCADNAQLAITDTAGRTINVSLTNKVGTAAVPTPPFFVAPAGLSLNSCAATSSAVAVGGSGTYFAGGGGGIVLPTMAGSLLTVSRTAGPVLVPPVSSVTVVVSDGKTTVNVPVSLTGTAATGPCP